MPWRLFPAVHQQGPVERLGDRHGDALDIGIAANTLEQDREFVAPEASHCVGRPGRFDQPLRRCLQRAVAGIVSERVVDVLEVIEVEEHDSDSLLRPLRQSQRVLDTVPE